VKEVLSQALELDTGPRRSFLDSACANDAALREEIDLLLAQRVDPGADVIEQCAADAAVRMRFVAQHADAQTGSRIGPYRILREIGHGGMGAVYLAERDDEHYRQQVAIKLIKPGLGGEAVRKRFRTEMQILADLNHPHIARLIDGGETTGGVPYLVLEYVAGVPLDVFCDEQQLAIRARLQLFATVCTAVQYAHQHLVIHRDIKPGNILVTSEGLPKLVDFGIAKLLDQDHANATATALPFMTPDYASPEQVRGEAVTTATDIYSLGVVLYELLTGRRPYRLKTGVPHEIAQAICDEEPQRPSTEQKRLHSDLDNIVLMAMRKEPQRRYATAEQFAEDIRRHLDGLPVRARADTFGYRAGKFVRRHKLGVAAAALITLTLLIGVVATLWQARVARAERARAERRFAEVRQLANSFVFEVHDAVVNLPGSTPARSLIVQRGLKYLDSLAQDAGGDRGLQRELAAAYEKLGAVQYTPSVAHLGDLAGALESHRKAAALRESLVAAEPNNSDYRRELLDSYWFIATLVGRQGDIVQEREIIRRQLPAREQLAAAERQGFVDRYNLAGTYSYIGSSSMLMGDAGGALEYQQRALQLREELTTLDPDKTRANRSLSISYEYLGLAKDEAGDTNGALELQQRGLQLREALVAADPLNTDLRLMLNESYRYVGDLHLRLGDVKQAAGYYTKQLSLVKEMVAADPANAQFLYNEAVALIKAGDVDAATRRAASALANYRHARELREQLSAAAAADTFLRRDLAEAWLKEGDALVLSKNRSLALASYHQAFQLLQDLSRLAAVNVDVRELLAEAQRKVAVNGGTVSRPTF
jgi:tetratricopeptide (TPR) repeat protein/tRNA A-37 threonylcarbamoyl transferase component Bud32